MATEEKKLKVTNDVEQVTDLNQEDIKSGFVSIFKIQDKDAEDKKNFYYLVKNHETNALEKIYCKNFIDCYLGIINSLLSSYGISKFTDDDMKTFYISDSEGRSTSKKKLTCGKYIETNFNNPTKLKKLRDFVIRINELNNTKEDVFFNFGNYTSNERIPPVEEVEKNKDIIFFK